jgi:hypothetical protein
MHMRDLTRPLTGMYMRDLTRPLTGMYMRDLTRLHVINIQELT